jgi:carbon monoxide dehydrogenase subunit G
MSTVSVSAHILATPEQVWETVMDPQRLGEWVTIHRGLGHTDPGPPRVGYEMDQHIHLRGVNLEVHWQLAQCQPCRLAVWQGRGPARSKARIEYALHPESGGTRFDYRNDFRPPLGPIGALASRALVGGIPEREARRTLDRLSELLGNITRTT